MKRRSNCSGFTLLEVMVAVAILAVGMVSVFQLFSGSLRSAKVSADYSKAVLAAQKKMDEIAGCLYLGDFDQVVRQGEFGSDEDDYLEGYHWEITDEDYEIPELEEEWSKNNASVDQKKFLLKKISVQVSWSSGENEKKMELVTLKMLYKDEDESGNVSGGES